MFVPLIIKLSAKSQFYSIKRTWEFIKLYKNQLLLTFKLKKIIFHELIGSNKNAFEDSLKNYKEGVYQYKDKFIGWILFLCVFFLILFFPICWDYLNTGTDKNKSLFNKIK